MRGYYYSIRPAMGQVLLECKSHISYLTLTHELMSPASERLHKRFLQAHLGERLPPRHDNLQRSE